jgi:hypothetical protein
VREQITRGSRRRQASSGPRRAQRPAQVYPGDGNRASRLAAMSSATVSSLSTAGRAPARTADRTAAVVDSASTTVTGTWRPSAPDKAAVSRSNPTRTAPALIQTVTGAGYRFALTRDKEA